jgi:hypothetical protein
MPTNIGLRGVLTFATCVSLQVLVPSLGYSGEDVTTSPDAVVAEVDDLRAQAVTALQTISEVGNADLAECIIAYFERNMYGSRLEDKFRYFVWVGQHGWPNTGAERSALASEGGVSRTAQNESEFHFGVALEICS